MLRKNSPNKSDPIFQTRPTTFTINNQERDNNNIMLNSMVSFSLWERIY